MVWQTRCVKKCPPEKLILVPWADELSRAARAAASPDDSAPTKDNDSAASPPTLPTRSLAAAGAAKDKTAGAEKDRKRPKALHPYLPWRVTCEVGYDGSANGEKDNEVFQVQSPLTSKQDGGLSPAPFWGVLASKDAEKVNMEVRRCTLTMPRMTMSVDDIHPQKKKNHGGQYQLFGFREHEASPRRRRACRGRGRDPGSRRGGRGVYDVRGRCGVRRGPHAGDCRPRTCGAARHARRLVPRAARAAARAAASPDDSALRCLAAVGAAVGVAKAT